MKRFGVYMLILVILLPMFSRLAIIGHFTTHQAEIIQTLCENKARPELQCAGSCQLRKRLGASGSELRQGAAPVPESLGLAFPELIYTMDEASDGALVLLLPAKLYAPPLMLCAMSGHALCPDQPPQAA